MTSPSTPHPTTYRHIPTFPHHIKSLLLLAQLDPAHPLRTFKMWHPLLSCPPWSSNFETCPVDVLSVTICDSQFAIHEDVFWLVLELFVNLIILLLMTFLFTWAIWIIYLAWSRKKTKAVESCCLPSNWTTLIHSSWKKLAATRIHANIFNWSVTNMGFVFCILRIWI